MRAHFDCPEMGKRRVNSEAYSDLPFDEEKILEAKLDFIREMRRLAEKSEMEVEKESEEEKD